MLNLRKTIFLSIKSFTVSLLISLLLLFSCLSLNSQYSYFNHSHKMKRIYKNSNQSVYPNENFISLNRKIYNRETKLYETYTNASGIVFDRKDNEVYALTAAHWCDLTDDMSFIEYMMMFGYDDDDYELAVEQSIAEVTYYGLSYEGTIIDYDIDTDVCLIKFNSQYASKSKKIKVAKSYPLIGEKIYTVSSPLGLGLNPHFRLHFEGKFSGCSDVDFFCMYTLPGTHGSSGSGVLNKKGEIVGVLSVAVVEFTNVTGGSRIESINEIIDKNLD